MLTIRREEKSINQTAEEKEKATSKNTFEHVRTAKIQISLRILRNLIRIFTRHILESQGCKVSSCEQ